MSLNKLFEQVAATREAASWQAAFGTPQVVEGKTLIPVAQVSYGWGLGFGAAFQKAEGAEAPSGEGGGGGGGSGARPLGVLVATPERIHFEPTLDLTKLGTAGMAFAAWMIFQVARTVRAFRTGA